MHLDGVYLRPHSSPKELYLDLSKIFNRNPHSQLLTKLPDYGVNNIKATWVKAYLSNRKQFVEFKAARSDIVCNFFCYTNYITGLLENSVTPRLFVNDCMLYLTFLVRRFR